MNGFLLHEVLNDRLPNSLRFFAELFNITFHLIIQLVDLQRANMESGYDETEARSAAGKPAYLYSPAFGSVVRCIAGRLNHHRG